MNEEGFWRAHRLTTCVPSDMLQWHGCCSCDFIFSYLLVDNGLIWPLYVSRKKEINFSYVHVEGV